MDMNTEDDRIRSQDVRICFLSLQNDAGQKGEFRIIGTKDSI
jgi:hypothetical protein